MSGLNTRHLQYIVIFSGLVVSVLYAYGHKVDGDVIQLLRNGHNFVVKGIVTPFGSQSSSGSSGNVPGAFLTLAVGVPMKIWHSPWSSLVLLTGLHLTALFMYLNVMKNVVSSAALLALSVLFWLNPWRASEVFLWNPGYIFFASIFHFWTAYHLSEKRSFVFSMLHALSLFLAFQIHASFVILVFITLILLWMRALKPDWVGAGAGILLGLASLLPYFLAGLKDPSIFPQPGSGGKGFLFFGLVYVYPLLKGFWYWILFGSTIFQKHIFHQLEFSWIQPAGLQLATGYVWTGVKYAIGLAGVLLSFHVNYAFFKGNKTVFHFWRVRLEPGDNWVVFYTVAAFVATMTATAISPTLPIFWHLLFVWPFALIPLILFIDHRFHVSGEAKKITALIWICAVYFLIFNIFGALGSTKHSIHSNFNQAYHSVCQDECHWPPKESAAK
jgi:hypothetical protein